MQPIPTCRKKGDKENLDLESTPGLKLSLGRNLVDP